MKMHLWILRHGQAEPHTRPDSERALTPQGEHDARAVGQWLAEVVPDSLHVLASPYKRAQQTAQQALLAMPNKKLHTVAWLTPDHDPLEVIAELEKLHHQHVLLVSHQPLVSALVGLLADGDYRAGSGMDTASLAEVVVSTLAPGCGILRSLRHAPDYRKSVM